MAKAGAKSEYDGDRSICLFPTYIDARRTVAEGRKLPANLAVECPSHQEIGIALQNLRLPFAFEQKKYSRDVWMAGRFRVKIFTDDKKPINPQIKNRREMMIEVGKFIAALPNRQLPPKRPPPTPLAERSKVVPEGGKPAKGAAAASTSASAGTAAAKGGKGKK